ncbi:Viral Genome polyprotein [Chamberlinius hualienensis]
MAKTTRRQKEARKEKGFQTGNHSLNPDRPASGVKGVGKVRDKATINRLLMYKNFKPKRNRKGKIVKAAPFQSWLTPGTQARVEPNQRWFGNTKVIGQNALQKFQEELGKALKNPYQVIMRNTKLPITLLNERGKQARSHLLDTETFNSTFGPKSTRKRPSLKFTDLQQLTSQAEESGDKYVADKDSDLVRDAPDAKNEPREMIMYAGLSRRVWNELYKVIDSSDVIVQVLDARDPLGTRSPKVEEFLRKDKPFKQLFFLLNKCDLVPTWATKKWVAVLSAEYPTMAFHASLRNPFGKGALINLLRQFGKLHQDKKQISVGFIGYPNVGKSSVINTLRSKKVCKVAPIAGETKVWQYITLMRRIYLIDCPGVVYSGEETDVEKVLKGVVRVEMVKAAEDYIEHVLGRVKEEYIKKTYGVEKWTDHEDFLKQLAKMRGKLLKGGEEDTCTVAKMVLNDWQRGKLPYFVLPIGCEPPPDSTNEPITAAANEEDEVEEDISSAEDEEDEKVETVEIDEIEAENEEIEGLEKEIEVQTPEIEAEETTVNLISVKRPTEIGEEGEEV